MRRECPELATRRHLTQPAVEVVRPSMERTANLGQARAGALAERAASVQTRVLEGAQHAVVVAHDEHRQVSDAYFVVIAGIRDMVDRARELPDARPEPL